jgi:hypothetical protein
MATNPLAWRIPTLERRRQQLLAEGNRVQDQIEEIVAEAREQQIATDRIKDLIASVGSGSPDTGRAGRAWLY